MSDDRTVYWRPSDSKWVDKRNDVSRGFVFDTQTAAITSARKKMTNAGGSELTLKVKDGNSAAKTRSAVATIRYRRAIASTETGIILPIGRMFFNKLATFVEIEVQVSNL